MQQRQGRPRNSLLPTKVSSYLNVLLKLVLILTGRVLYYLLQWLVLILPAMHCICREHFVWYLTDVDRIICCFILHFRIFIQNGNVTRSRWSASNLDLRVALKVIAVSLFLSCQHLPWRRISVLKVISKYWWLASITRGLVKRQSLPMLMPWVWQGCQDWELNMGPPCIEASTQIVTKGVDQVVLYNKARTGDTFLVLL